MDAGTWQPDPVPTPRPVDWGTKAKTRAVERARGILAGARRHGLAIDLELLTVATMERANVGRETAQAAAEFALSEPETTETKTPRRGRRR